MVYLIAVVLVGVLGALSIARARSVQTKRWKDELQTFESPKGDFAVARRPHRVAARASAVRHLLEGDGTFAIAAVGESHHLAGFEAALGPRTIEGVVCTTEVRLVREPENSYDPMAVALYLGPHKTGYLARDDARRFGPLLSKLEQEKRHAVCVGNVRGGWDRGDGDEGDFGLWLDLPPTAKEDTKEYRPVLATSLQSAIEKLSELKTRGARERLVLKTLPLLGFGEEREALLLAASKFEVQRVMEKLRSLKSVAVKRKHLQEVIRELEQDELPDELQAAEINLLKNELNLLMPSAKARAKTNEGLDRTLDD